MAPEKACQIRWLGRLFNETIQLPDFADELDGDRPQTVIAAPAGYPVRRGLSVEPQASPDTGSSAPVRNCAEGGR
jgi:hypothetical protein